jgi:hypothetical protein
MRDDDVLAPAGPDELFRQYYGYVRKIVTNTPAILAQDAEDVAMEIMTRLLERDVLGMFDPDMRFEHDGKEIPARFRTFLLSQVQVYVRGQRDRLARQRRHESVVLDAEVTGLFGDDGMRRTVADLFGGTEDDLSFVDAAEFVRQARAFLAAVPRRSRQDQCDLVQLFDELVSQALSTGSVQVRETAVRLGVSPSVSRRWITWLRQNLRQQAVLSQRVLVCGEPYTTYHVQQAVSVLRTVKGAPFVKQPLRSAGNPLWAMDYHAVARYERATYPECEVPSRHRGKGYFAPHVLTAVVHYLERAAPEVLVP